MVKESADLPGELNEYFDFDFSDAKEETPPPKPPAKPEKATN